MTETGFLVGGAILLAVAGVIAFAIRKKRIPFTHEREIPWAIGLYGGSSPFALAPAEGVKNPVLRADDVTDVDARFVADPFLICSGDTWYLFFEVLNAEKKKGQIAYATSKDAINWNYQQVVLDEPFHLSYPYVFNWEGSYYMVPESCRSGGIRLYKAEAFPAKWRFAGNILKDVDYVDTSIFRHDSKWWLFTTRSYPNSSSLYLYYADDLLGPWVEHPKSPVVQSDLRRARPAGRVLVTGSSIIRYAQDLERGYGLGVRAFEVTRLSETDYEERALAGGQPIVAPTGRGWNGVGMHHVDAHETAGGHWLAVVDGRGKERVFGPRRPRGSNKKRHRADKDRSARSAPPISEA